MENRAYAAKIVGAVKVGEDVVLRMRDFVWLVSQFRSIIIIVFLLYDYWYNVVAIISTIIVIGLYMYRDVSLGNINY